LTERSARSPVGVVGMKIRPSIRGDERLAVGLSLHCQRRFAPFIRPITAAVMADIGQKLSRVLMVRPPLGCFGRATYVDDPAEIPRRRAAFRHRSRYQNVKPMFQQSRARRSSPAVPPTVMHKLASLKFFCRARLAFFNALLTELLGVGIVLFRIVFPTIPIEFRR